MQDLARLERATFYFANRAYGQAFKIRTPLCLSCHPAKPLGTDEIAERARSAAKTA